MRLICGLWNLDGKPADAETLAAMARAMIADGQIPRITTWRDGPVGLAVIDYSRGSEAAPALFSGKDGRVLAADIRLDAPDELARSLGQEAAEENALILGAIEHWGAEAPRHVLGDYAFAVWDQKARTILCARDALGVRPLVYTHRPRKLFAFASLPRALHGAGLVDRQLNEIAFARRLLQAWRADDTPFANINRLSAGYILEVSASGLTTRPYWRVPAHVTPRSITPEDASKELRNLIEGAVRCRLPGAGPVASHLSGGLDSSAIAILAARNLRREGRALLTYSFLARPSDGPPLEDETPFVDAVRSQETDISWTSIHEPEFLRRLTARIDVDRVLSIEPDDPENAICIDAAGRGAELVLSGWGGDEGPTFNGRGALAEGLLRGRWRYVASEFAALKRIRGWTNRQICNGEFLSYLAPDWLIGLERHLRGRPPPLTRQFQDLLAPSLVASLGSIDADLLSLGPDAHDNQLRLLSSPHIAERTENWANIGARYGLAFAFPMLDRRVVEFVVSLTSELFLRGGFKRRVFRDAMAGILPELIRWRHHKLVPLPDLLPRALAHRDAIIERLRDAARHPRVRAMFNIERLQAATACWPSSDQLYSHNDNFSTNAILVVCNIEIESVVRYDFVCAQQHFDWFLVSAGNWNHVSAPRCCVPAMSSVQS